MQARVFQEILLKRFYNLKQMGHQSAQRKDWDLLIRKAKGQQLYLLTGVALSRAACLVSVRSLPPPTYSRGKQGIFYGADNAEI